MSRPLGLMIAVAFSYACSHTPAPVYDISALQSGKVDYRKVKSKHRKPINKPVNYSAIATQLRNNQQALKSTSGKSLPVSQVALADPQLPEVSLDRINDFTKRNGYHLVKTGETLFSIAWQYSLDHRELAAINQIKDNLIYPGQRLLLMPQQQGQVFDAASLVAALNKDILKTPVDYQRSKDKNLSVANQPPQAPVPKSRLSQSAAKLPQAKTASINRVKQSANSNKTTKSHINWIWPTDGTVLADFSLVSNKGLDIAGRRGQAVRASAPGQVVYSGNGLRGYGKLVIIKHDNDYLSAYAHNNKIYVSESEIVKAGQRIADVGNSGTQDYKLHFEIRYKGKPVDPLNYLPNKDN